MTGAVLDWLRRRWDVALDPERPVSFARRRARINLKRLELIAWIALANECGEAFMNIGFGLRAYYWTIGANMIVDALVIVIARSSLEKGGRPWQAAVTPAVVTAMLLVAQGSIYSLTTMGRYTNVYPLYVLLVGVVFVLRPRTLAAIIAATLVPYAVMVHYSPVAAIDQISAIRTAVVAGMVVTLAGSLIHAARERDHAQTLEIHDRNARLQRRNAEMDDVMAFAAHDLRSPLLGLRNLVAFALPRLDADPALAARTLDEAGRSLDDTLARIGRLLAAHEAEYAPLRIDDAGDLRLLLAAAARRNGPLAQAAGVALDLSLPESPVFARHDAGALDRVLDNVIVNAVRHSPAGSRVTLRCQAEARHATLSVEDDGVGVPEEERAHLFDKFRSGQASSAEGRAGSGLGLFIVATLVERMGGRISFRPSPSNGAVFAIEIPKGDRSPIADVVSD